VSKETEQKKEDPVIKPGEVKNDQKTDVKTDDPSKQQGK
jgi:hypothetical protein